MVFYFRKKGNCCTIDVWGIAINITLQDAPFLVFRLLLILHFNIISYMNVFFTCKNTLVILLQLYRLYVVYSESHKKAKKKSKNDFELTDISIISKPDMYKQNRTPIPKRLEKHRKPKQRRQITTSESELSEVEVKKKKKINSRKDTGYSTASSHTSHKHKINKKPGSRELKKVREKSQSRSSEMHKDKDHARKQKKLRRSDLETKINIEDDTEASLSEYTQSEKEEKSFSKKLSKRKSQKDSTTVSISDPSSD